MLVILHATEGQSPRPITCFFHLDAKPHQSETLVLVLTLIIAAPVISANHTLPTNHPRHLQERLHNRRRDPLSIDHRPELSLSLIPVLHQDLLRQILVDDLS